MTAKEILSKLSDHQDDYEFFYQGKSGAICIFDKKIIAGYDGSETTFSSLSELMAEPFIDGKTLTECADEIEIYG